MEAFQALLGDDFCFLLSPHIVARTPRKRPIMTPDHADKMEITVVFQCPHQGKDVLTLEEAAKFMGIARSSLYKMTHEQTIPFYKPNGKMIFFEKSDLLAWVRKNRVSSEAEISEEAERIIQRLATK